MHTPSAYHTPEKKRFTQREDGDHCPQARRARASGSAGCDVRFGAVVRQIHHSRRGDGRACVVTTADGGEHEADYVRRTK